MLHNLYNPSFDLCSSFVPRQRSANISIYILWMEAIFSDIRIIYSLSCTWVCCQLFMFDVAGEVLHHDVTNVIDFIYLNSNTSINNHEYSAKAYSVWILFFGHLLNSYWFYELFSTYWPRSWSISISNLGCSSFRCQGRFSCSSLRRNVSWNMQHVNYIHPFIEYHFNISLRRGVYGNAHTIHLNSSCILVYCMSRTCSYSD